MRAAFVRSKLDEATGEIWSLRDLERVPITPAGLLLRLERHTKFGPRSSRLAAESWRRLFAERVAGCPELLAHLDMHGKDTEIRDTLARVELEIQRIDLEITICKKDERGEALAVRLTELDAARAAAVRRIPPLKKALEMFAADVKAARDAASKALERIARQVDTEEYDRGKAKLTEAKEELLKALEPYLERVVELLEMARPPHPGRYTDLHQQALAGTLTAEAPESEDAPLLRQGLARIAERNRLAAATAAPEANPTEDPEPEIEFTEEMVALEAEISAELDTLPPQLANAYYERLDARQGSQEDAKRLLTETLAELRSRHAEASEPSEVEERGEVEEPATAGSP